MKAGYWMILMVVLLWGCGSADLDDLDPNSNLQDGDDPDGDVADGDTPDGDVVDGDTPDGDVVDGDTPDGDVVDGDTPDGDVADGDTSDGDVADGDTSDGDVADGDVVDGDTSDGDVVDGDTSDGEVCDPCTHDWTNFCSIGTPCTSVADCSTAMPGLQSICENGWCETTGGGCSIDAQCEAYCQATYPDETYGDYCETNRWRCVHNGCAGGANYCTVGTPCTTVGDCPPAQPGMQAVCDGGWCETTGDGCSTHSQCDAWCQSQYPSETYGTFCQTNPWICKPYDCAPNQCQASTACATAADCVLQPGQVAQCDNGRCVVGGAGCSTDAQCDQWCNATYPSETYGDFCDTNAWRCMEL